jgi:hypothetical protein
MVELVNPDALFANRETVRIARLLHPVTTEGGDHSSLNGTLKSLSLISNMGEPIRLVDALCDPGICYKVSGHISSK